MKTNLIIKTIEHKGITVSYKIDFDLRTLSLVEKNGKNWQTKQWVFPERTPEYLNSWINIMEAMQEAVIQAKLELDAHIEKETDELTEKIIKSGGDR